MKELLGTIQRNDPTSTIRLTRLFRTAPQDLWEAIVDPQRAGRWLGELSGDLKLGGHYRIVFDASDPTQRVDGRIVGCAPGESLEVTWQAPGEDVSNVRVDLTPAGSGTQLVLTHSNLRAPASDTGHAAGWQVHLEQLASGIEHDTWTDQWDTWVSLEHAYAAELSKAGSQESSDSRRAGS